MRALSFSSLTAYEECALRWKLHYVDGLPFAERGYFSFGSALHDALEAWATAVPPPATLDATLAAFRAAWDPKGFDAETDAQAHLALGENILREFVTRNAANFRAPLAVEHKFRLTLEGVPILGYIDRIDLTDDDRLAVLDYKSGKRPMTIPDAAASEQLTLYQHAVERDFGREVARVAYYNLRSQTVVEAPRRPDAQLAALTERFVAAAEGIEANRFEPHLNRTCPCEFAHLCPYFAELGSTKQQRLPTEGPPIAELVDAYAHAKNDERIANAEVERLGDQIRDHMREHNVRRVSGTDALVTYTPGERTHFDEAQARAILAQAGLLERALKLDEKKIRAILDDTTVPRETRTRLKRIEQHETTRGILRISAKRETHEENGEPRA